MWFALRASYLVAVVLCNIQDSLEDEDTKRSFLTRRAIDGSRGRKYYDAKDDGFFGDYGFDRGHYNARDRSGSSDIRSSVPGEPGVDYPAYERLPQTRFTCEGRDRGYYADDEAGCQMFHVCDNILVSSFLCPVGSLFSQKLQTCDWWNKVDCSTTRKFYTINRNHYDQDDGDEMIRKAYVMIHLHPDEGLITEPEERARKIIHYSRVDTPENDLPSNYDDTENSQSLDDYSNQFKSKSTQDHDDRYNDPILYSQEYQTHSPKIYPDPRLLRVHKIKNDDHHNSGKGNSYRLPVNEFVSEFKPAYAPTVPTVTTTSRRFYSPTVPMSYRSSTLAYDKFDQNLDSSVHLYEHGRNLPSTTPSSLFNSRNSTRGFLKFRASSAKEDVHYPEKDVNYSEKERKEEEEEYEERDQFYYDEEDRFEIMEGRESIGLVRSSSERLEEEVVTQVPLPFVDAGNNSTEVSTSRNLGEFADLKNVNDSHSVITDEGVLRKEFDYESRTEEVSDDYTSDVELINITRTSDSSVSNRSNGEEKEKEGEGRFSEDDLAGKVDYSETVDNSERVDDSEKDDRTGKGHQNQNHSENSKERENYSREQGYLKNDQDRSKDHPDSLKDYTDYSREDQDYSKENQDHSRKHQDFLKHQGYPKENQDSSKNNQDYSKENQNYSKENQDYSRENQDHSRKYQDSPKNHEDYSKENQDHSRKHQDYPKENQDSQKNHQDYSNENQNYSKENQDHSRKHQDFPKHQDYPKENQDSRKNYQDFPNHQDDSTEHQDSTTSDPTKLLHSQDKVIPELSSILQPPLVDYQSFRPDSEQPIPRNPPPIRRPPLPYQHHSNDPDANSTGNLFFQNKAENSKNFDSIPSDSKKKFPNRQFSSNDRDEGDIPESMTRQEEIKINQSNANTDEEIILRKFNPNLDFTIRSAIWNQQTQENTILNHRTISLDLEPPNEDPLLNFDPETSSPGIISENQEFVSDNINFSTLTKAKNENPSSVKSILPVDITASQFEDTIEESNTPLQISLAIDENPNMQTESNEEAIVQEHQSSSKATSDLDDLKLAEENEKIVDENLETYNRTGKSAEIDNDQRMRIFQLMSVLAKTNRLPRPFSSQVDKISDQSKSTNLTSFLRKEQILEQLIRSFGEPLYKNQRDENQSLFQLPYVNRFTEFRTGKALIPEESVENSGSFSKFAAKENEENGAEKTREEELNSEDEEEKGEATEEREEEGKGEEEEEKGKQKEREQREEEERRNGEEKQVEELIEEEEEEEKEGKVDVEKGANSEKLEKTVVEMEFLPSLAFSFDTHEGREEYAQAVLHGLVTEGAVVKSNDKFSFDSTESTKNF